MIVGFAGAAVAVTANGMLFVLTAFVVLFFIVSVYAPAGKSDGTMKDIYPHPPPVNVTDKTVLPLLGPV